MSAYAPTSALTEEILTQALNAPQLEAVMHAPGPQLILAGAGSGKTRVLTWKIAWLIQAHGYRPEEILAVTFTNKAAKEMRSRVEKLLGYAARLRWMGTFHSICARLLRLHATRLGYGTGFTIFDTDDQKKFVKRLLKDQKLEEDARFADDKVRHAISAWKNLGHSHEQALKEAQDRYEERLAELYRLYQTEMQKANAMDFDDLIFLSIRLLTAFPEIRELYRGGFHYVLVDEYQDTNKAQYQLIKLLLGKHGNLVVVGDDDQSIYGWRGADIGNILSFKRDHPAAKITKLEQNYRSSGHILGIAGSVIRNNRQRMEKKVWTSNALGEKPNLIEVEDDTLEAAWVARKIRDDVRFKPGETAVFYRTNAQSRLLEDEMRRQRIPYLIVGGIRFYERKEVKDVLGYLRLLVNPRDTLSLQRVLNVPKRGIGETSWQKVLEMAERLNLAPISALSRASEAGIPTATARKMTDFVSLLRVLREQAPVLPLPELIAEVINRSGYRAFLEQEGTEEDLDRLANIEELVSAAQDFVARKDRGEIESFDGPEIPGEQMGLLSSLPLADDDAAQWAEAANPKGSQNPSVAQSGERGAVAGALQDLDLFLQEIALVSDADTLRQSQEAVTLMTVHSAKGLEFPQVFVTGLEDGLFPMLRDDDGDLEEERRLFYVAVTRAERVLHLSYARRRRRYGSFQDSMGSRFISEIDKQHLSIPSPKAKPRVFYQDPDESLHHRQPEVAYEDFSQESEGLRKGQQVQHDRFGVGTVMGVEGVGEGARIIVVFSDRVRRTLLAKFANLRPVGGG